MNLIALITKIGIFTFLGFIVLGACHDGLKDLWAKIKSKRRKP